MEEYDPFEDSVEIKKVVLYSKKHFFSLFFKTFKKSDYITSIVLFLLTVVSSIYLTFEVDNLYNLIKEVSGNLISYFSISVGFSFATLVFIIDNSFKHLKNSDNNNTLIEIIALITGYILHGLFIIIVLIIQYFLGAIFTFNGMFYNIVNSVSLTLILFLIVSNLLIFIKIIKVVYYFSYITINNNDD